jgi:cytochrome c oxidase cbb3-type subunit 2
MRYGEYSKAGEFANDRPFLWGSKRTGPDLARVGGKYPDAWHVKHYGDPQAFFAQSNMPKYGWLASRRLDPDAMRSRMRVNGFPFTEEEIGALAGKSELDALVAYTQAIGAAVKAAAPAAAAAAPPDARNPFADQQSAIEAGRALYDTHCASCHGEHGSGDIGANLEDYDADDPDFYTIIAQGYEGEMPGFAGQLDRKKIWSIVTYVRSLAPVEKAPEKEGHR